MKKNAAMNKREEFKTNQITSIVFPVEVLRPLQRLYWQIYADMLPPGVDIGLKLHESAPEFSRVRMQWFFADSEKAIGLFRDVLDSCSLAQARDAFGNDRHQVRVVQANIIEIRGSYPIGTWHSDFTDENFESGASATLLTPLFTFKPHYGGLEFTTAKRESPCDYDRLLEVYRYRDGEAVLFDGSGMIHRTQSYNAELDERRVLISWQLADVRRELIPTLEKIGKKNGDPMFFSSHFEK